MPSTVSIVALLCSLLGLFFLIATFKALRHGRLIRVTTRLLFTVVWFALAGLFGALVIGTRGYYALTHEAVAAVVDIQPLTPQRFRAQFRFPDGRTRSYTISGDELYVDARVLKWKPIANFFGLHTVYELDRVAGRYRYLTNEQQSQRTVYALKDDRELVDLFELRQRYVLLAPLLDAEYGSATFVSAVEPQTLEVRVSTGGLLIRRIPERVAPTPVTK